MEEWIDLKITSRSKFFEDTKFSKFQSNHNHDSTKTDYTAVQC